MPAKLIVRSSSLEDLLAEQIKLAGLREPAREYRFIAANVGGTGKGLRQRLAKAGLQDWRFDFAWPFERQWVWQPGEGVPPLAVGVAFEVEGGTWTGGRHTRGQGFEDDCRKYSWAAILGWRVLRGTGAMIRSGEALKLIERALR